MPSSVPLDPLVPLRFVHLAAVPEAHELTGNHQPASSRNGVAAIKTQRCSGIDAMPYIRPRPVLLDRRSPRDRRWTQHGGLMTESLARPGYRGTLDSCATVVTWGSRATTLWLVPWHVLVRLAGTNTRQTIFAPRAGQPPRLLDGAHGSRSGPPWHCGGGLPGRLPVSRDVQPGV